MASWLTDAASARPGHVAIDAPDGTLTYAELLARAEAAAPGPLLDAEPSLAFAIALHARLLRGEPAVPVDPRWGPGERAHLAEPEARPGVVVHTSGTTGRPRPVHLAPARVERNARATAEALAIGPADRWLCPLPLAHVGGLMILLRAAITRTTAVLRPGFDPADAAGATLASLVPTQLARALAHPPPPGLRAVLLGGAGAPRALRERARDAGWPVRATYGLTQACSTVTLAEPGDVETAGRPLPGYALAIAADGEIAVDGEPTGDLGRLDDRGRLVVLGRKADTIVSGGENVMPDEVEAALLAHPAVADAAVFGRPDPEWGEAVTAHVVLRAPVSAEELRAHVGERLARFKVPKAIVAVDALPRTASGKLLRRELASPPG